MQTSEGRIDLVEIRRARQQAQRERAQQLRARITERRRRERLKYVIENIRQFMPTDIHPTELDRAAGPDVIDWQRLGLLGNIQPAYDRIENFLLHSGRLDKYYEWVENKIKGGKIRKSKKRKKQRKSKKRKKQRKSKKRKKYKKNK